MHMSDTINLELSVRELAVLSAVLGTTDAERYEASIQGATDMPLTKAESIFGQTANIETREDVAVFLRILAILDNLQLEEVVE